MFRILTAIVVTFFVFSVAGCGYGLTARGHSSYHTIAIPLFANKSVRPNLETCLAERLVELFAASSGGRVESSGRADLELAGAVLAYGESASAFSAGDTVALYRLSMTVEASLRDLKTGAVIWKGVVRQTQDYPTSSDLALKINAQDAALGELCRKLAVDIEREISNRF